MLILGIESSCDETAAAVVESGFTVHASAVASQIAKHAAYGGVIPELAAREHLKAVDAVICQALHDAGLKSVAEVDGIAVTQGPGLVPALLIGYNYARALAASARLPLCGVNHFLAHIYAAFLDAGSSFAQNPEHYPVIALVVSGGHTAILKVDRDGTARLLGQTLDDAAGEAFDKAAKLLELGYPGGPVIQKVGALGDRLKYAFPRSLTPAPGHAMREEDRYNFSFSGVKTALLYHVQKQYPDLHVPPGDFLYDTVASYQEAIIDVLARKTFDAVKREKAKSVVLCGGVGCNGPLRERFTQKTPSGVHLCMASPKNCTDNAVMIAGLGYHQLQHGDRLPLEADVYAKLPQIARFVAAPEA